MSAKEMLANFLFADDGLNAYAILDGAACPELMARLDEFQPEYCCLYPGELAPDVEACAPHLVTLQPDAPFTDWLLENLPGKPWGIFARAEPKLRPMRKHFRTFIVVTNEQGRKLFFRFYDPRVIRVFLPTCDAEQFQNFFGPVDSYISEDEKHDFVAYRYVDKKFSAKRLDPGALSSTEARY